MQYSDKVVDVRVTMEQRVQPVPSVQKMVEGPQIQLMDSFRHTNRVRSPQYKLFGYLGRYRKCKRCGCAQWCSTTTAEADPSCPNDSKRRQGFHREKVH